ncbi:MAG: glycosyltransferase [Pseudomonadota bacterium]
MPDRAPKSYLLIHPVSYCYVKSSANYIYEKLQEFSPGEVECIFCEDIELAPVNPGSIVYVIGDPFKPFTRRKERFYVFMNFSLIYFLGNPLHCSWSAYKWIREKRSAFDSKIACYDYILDYYASQVPVMREKTNIPVAAFPTGVERPAADSKLSRPDRKYDVCIVGTPSPRRLRMISKLRKKGFSLSPVDGVVFESIAAESRIVLNMHLHRSNHLELPRIVGALVSGAALVTEHCWGLDDYLPPDMYVAASEDRLADAVEELITDQARLDSLSARAGKWMENVYFKNCDAQWQNVLPEIHQRFRNSDVHR